VIVEQIIAKIKSMFCISIRKLYGQHQKEAHAFCGFDGLKFHVDIANIVGKLGVVSLC
jgi:hypothetical protein